MALTLLKEADFRKEIKSNPQKCYLFFGEEDYMKNFSVKKVLIFFNKSQPDRK